VWADAPTGGAGFSFTGVTGAILYSPDGVGVTGSAAGVYNEDLLTVTTQIPLPGVINGIAYGPTGGYVAVGNNNLGNTLYISSPDGISWTSGTGPIFGSLRGIAYGPTHGYVAVGYEATNSIYLSSPDGVSWTASSEMGTTTIIKTSLTVDKLIDNVNSTGYPGQVLTAGPTGAGLMWADINLLYNPADPSYWESPAPATVQEALDRISKYIYTSSSAVIPL
jgi:hypothetical protein